jgi:hypothetical protein
MNDDGQGDLWPHHDIDFEFHHALSADVTTGKMRARGRTAHFVYTAILAHIDRDTGWAEVKQEQLAKETGLTAETVGKATQKLVALGHLKEKWVANAKHYRVILNIPMLVRGEVVAHAKRDYTPTKFLTDIDEIKDLAYRGMLPPGTVLNINVINSSGDNATIVIGNDRGQTADELAAYARKMQLLRS